MAKIWWNSDSSSKTEKCLLFHRKSSFRSRDIHIFVFLSSYLFLPAGYCFREWLKINLKVYDIINCLNKNLLTHFVWHKNVWHWNFVHRWSIKEGTFYGKILAENMHQKLVLDPFLILVDNSKQPLHAVSSFKNEIF